MKPDDMKLRRESIIARELDIKAQLTEMKRNFVVHGVPGDFALRTTLEAELATLAVEKNLLTKALNDHKTVMKAYRSALAHAQLIRLVTERGLGELVLLADRPAAEAAGVGVEVLHD